MDQREAVERVLDEKIRPYLRTHGGEACVTAIEGGTVYLRLGGACAGCPAADLSTRALIEEALRGSVEGVDRVELEDSVSPELLDLARKILHRNDPAT